MQKQKKEGEREREREEVTESLGALFLPHLRRTFSSREPLIRR